MIFTSSEYVYFLVIILGTYWLLRKKTLQNILLLIASYIFYGFVHPWFCILIAASTIIDYICGLAMEHLPDRKKIFLIISLSANLGMLGFFKYFNFFTDNFIGLLSGIGLNVHPWSLRIFLPVGISFYTFQTLSYTIDIYRNQLRARRNFIDFAVFVSFFPQLVAGPIERASRFLPQVENERKFNFDVFKSAWPLLITGYLKKLVIADNVAIYVDKIFMLESPGLELLFCGAIGFAIQIYADFSAYTDIARGSARLLGFELMENFKSPYLAISPSDFWRRWHISLSSWINDYLYVPLGGSRVDNRFKFFLIVLTSLGLSGLWHGAAWNFVAWGLYHAIILFAYHQIGCGGKWRPSTRTTTVLAWIVMINLTLIGWLIFRTPDMSWLVRNMGISSVSIFGPSALTAVTYLLLYSVVFSLPYWVLYLMNRWLNFDRVQYLHAAFYGLAAALIIIFYRNNPQDFIYFQF